MEELLAILRGCSSPIDMVIQDFDYHGGKLELEGVIGDFHEQTMQWNQFISTELGIH